MIFQHAYEEPFPLTEAAADVPQPIVDLVARMMAKDPDERHPDCQAVLADVQAYREDRPPAAVEDDAGKRPAMILPVADPSSELQLPAELAVLPDDRRPRRVRDFAATLFRRHAPEFIHRVRITRAFYMGVCEVTQAPCAPVMGSNPSNFKKSGPDAPVEQVSWEDAAEFCRRLSGMVEAKAAKYRLPTEAEWECACQGGTTTAWCFGDSELELSDYAWHKANSEGKMHPVGQKKPNPFGLYDSYGNVWEWCADWHDSDYYANSPASDPPGPERAEKRVRRGGSWNYHAVLSRSADRYLQGQSNGTSILGFRVACEIPSEPAKLD